MNRSRALFVCLAFLCVGTAPRQALGQAPDSTGADSTRHPDMRWFTDARLGIFIHWGIYAVDGIDESWSFYNGYISHADYLKQLDGFTASRYDPAEWARVISESGARYAVLTTRHHDGVALWDTDAGDLSVVSKTPAARDLVDPFVTAIRDRGLRVGLYYSHSDWSHPDYDQFTATRRRYTDDPERWARFLGYHHAQLRELVTRFQPDLLWFDGDWEHDSEAWGFRSLRDSIRVWQPDVVMNSRIGEFGDYATPEQGVPIVPPDGPWELSLTVNDTWGYQALDQNYKTPSQLIRIFSDVLSMGGNLLLNIGPRADGTIPERELAILEALGRWTTKHQEAIYGTGRGLPDGHFWGPSTLSADRKTLYLFVPYQPTGPLVVKGLKNRVQRVRIVGKGSRPSWDVVGKQYWSDVPGLLYVDLPATELDPDVTVVALLLDGPMEVYRKR
jgi:alpha-L-fucosidase